MSSSPFEVRGVVEGFYGAFYTTPERDDLIRFLGQRGYNLYIYGPKNDRQHRARWREPYPDKIMAQFRRTIETAQNSGVRFCYAISPGVSMCYSSPDDFGAITDKFERFYALGTRSFCIMLDDIASEFSHEADRQRYRSYAEAHIDLCNRLYDWLQALDPSSTLSMCPTDYHGKPPFSAYLHELGEGLREAIDVFYTGTGIYSSAISAEETSAFAQALRRNPIIWDNYPVNDLASQPNLHLGPARGRAADLVEHVKGFAINPMLQPEASKVALYTYGCYFHDPVGYDPGVCWNAAIQAVAGDESAAALRILADNGFNPAAGTAESDRLETQAQAVLASLKAGNSASDNPAVDRLLTHLTEIDEAGYHLKFRMDNLALRHDLLPWIELLETWVWAARYALWALHQKERGESFAHAANMMRESYEAAVKHHKRSGGAALKPLVEYAAEWIEASDSVQEPQDG